eukprot:gene12803-17682_t
MARACRMRDDFYARFPNLSPADPARTFDKDSKQLRYRSVPALIADLALAAPA